MNITSKYYRQVLNLTEGKGLLRPSDLDQFHIPRIVLRRMLDAGLLEKISRGVYRLPGSAQSEYETLLSVAVKVPQAVFCLLSALQFHELTTQLPWQVWIAMPRGSHLPKIDYPPLKLIQYTSKAYSEGIIEVQRDKVTFRVYSVAKTLADCFKHRNKIGMDVALEALKDAKQKKLLNMDELWHFSKICRVTNIIRPYLEALE